MTRSKALVSTTILTVMMGIASLAPASAVSAPQTPLTPLIGAESGKVQTVHCRAFLHTHRRCTLRRLGVCRRWVSYTHRCG